MLSNNFLTEFNTKEVKKNIDSSLTHLRMKVGQINPQQIQIIFLIFRDKNKKALVPKKWNSMESWGEK